MVEEIFEKFDSLAWKSTEFNYHLLELVEQISRRERKKEIILANLSDRFAILMIFLEARMMKNEKNKIDFCHRNASQIKKIFERFDFR